MRRIYLEFSDRTDSNIKNLGEQLGEPDFVQVIKRALALLDLALEARSKGGRLLCEMDGETTVVDVMPTNTGEKR